MAERTWRENIEEFEKLRLHYIKQDILNHMGDSSEASSLKDTQLDELAKRVLKELDFNDDYADIYWSIIRVCTRGYLREIKKEASK